MKLFIHTKQTVLEYDVDSCFGNSFEGFCQFKWVGKSKVKVTAAVDVEKVNSINAFVDQVVTENRLMQMKGKVVEMGLDGDDVKNIGTFLKFLGTDVIKEELDTIEASGLVVKDVMGKVNRVGKDWFIANIGKEIV